MEAEAAPSIADGVARQLDPRWIPLQRIRSAIFVVILAMPSFVGVIVLWIASGMLAAGLVLVPLWAGALAMLAWQLYRWPAIAYGQTWYRLDQDGFEIRRGVYWRTITNVPRSRVQHTDVSQGPLERRFGLGTLVIHTAGTQHAEVTLPGLDFTVAQDIRAHLLPSDHGDAV
jgi:hypothetical protein